MPTAHLGLDAKSYYGDAGATAENLMSNIREVTLNLEKAEADVTTRGGDGWRSMVGTLKEGTAEFVMLYDPDEAAFSAIKDAYFNNEPVALRFLHADGGEGLDADFTITNFSRPEPLEEAIMANVTAKIYTGLRTPVWEE